MWTIFARAMRRLKDIIAETDGRRPVLMTFLGFSDVLARYFVQFAPGLRPRASRAGLEGRFHNQAKTVRNIMSLTLWDPGTSCWEIRSGERDSLLYGSEISRKNRQTRSIPKNLSHLLNNRRLKADISLTGGAAAQRFVCRCADRYLIGIKWK